MSIISLVIFVKVFLIRDNSEHDSRYVVYSQSGEILYSVNGTHKSGSQKIGVFQGDACIAKIRDVAIANLRTNYVSLPQDKFHLVISQSRSKFSVIYHGVSFHIRGNVLEKSYDIMNIDNSVVACIQKRFDTSKETLEININNDKYLLHCITSAICLNCICTTDALALQAT